MLIDIEDELDGSERRRLLKILPTVYAMEKFSTKVEAARFLGVSVRGLAYIINNHVELHKYKFGPNWLQNRSQDEVDGYYDMKKRYPDE